jgi:hypothetical protein
LPAISDGEYEGGDVGVVQSTIASESILMAIVELIMLLFFFSDALGHFAMCAAIRFDWL